MSGGSSNGDSEDKPPHLTRADQPNGKHTDASPRRPSVEQQHAQPAVYNPVAEGIAFGDKELARIERERKDPPYLSTAIDLGGSGLTYDEYGSSVLEAVDPYQELNDDDRAVYGPPAEVSD